MPCVRPRVNIGIVLVLSVLCILRGGSGSFGVVWCSVVWFCPGPPVCGVMYETGVTMGWQPYMIQSKDEPLRAVAALFEDWLAGEEDWNP